MYISYKLYFFIYYYFIYIFYFLLYTLFILFPFLRKGKRFVLSAQKGFHLALWFAWIAVITK